MLAGRSRDVDQSLWGCRGIRVELGAVGPDPAFVEAGQGKMDDAETIESSNVSCIFAIVLLIKKKFLPRY